MAYCCCGCGDVVAVVWRWRIVVGGVVVAVLVWCGGCSGVVAVVVVVVWR